MKQASISQETDIDVQEVEAGGVSTPDTAHVLAPSPGQPGLFRLACLCTYALLFLLNRILVALQLQYSPPSTQQLREVQHAREIVPQICSSSSPTGLSPLLASKTSLVQFLTKSCGAKSGMSAPNSARRIWRDCHAPPPCPCPCSFDAPSACFRGPTNNAWPIEPPNPAVGAAQRRQRSPEKARRSLPRSRTFSCCACKSLSSLLLSRLHPSPQLYVLIFDSHPSYRPVITPRAPLGAHERLLRS